LDQYKKPEIVQGIKKFKKERKTAYKNSLEILGQDSKCNFDVSALIEGTNKNSGRYINKLGFYTTCKQHFRPKGSKQSIDSVDFSMDGEINDPTEYKKYYLAKIDWLLGLISKAFIGYCVPEACTE
jgi:hypothetical protein